MSKDRVKYASLLNGYYVVGLVIFEKHDSYLPRWLSTNQMRKQYAWMRTPHSMLLPDLRGKGIGKAVYSWALDNGWCLRSGLEHTGDARNLWTSLGKSYPLVMLDLETNMLIDYRLVKASSGPHRLVLLGKGWTIGSGNKVLK